MWILSNSSRSYVHMCRQSCITVLVHYFASNCRLSLLMSDKHCWRWSSTVGDESTWPQWTTMSSYRQLAMTNWCDHGWYSWAIGSRKMICTNSVAHIMNDETTRKYLQFVNSQTAGEAPRAHRLLPNNILVECSCVATGQYHICMTNVNN
jgi:hypothetical protein